MNENMSDNPFQSPMFAAPQRDRSMSGFNKGWIITDLVFCLLRVPLVLLAIVGVMAMQAEEVLTPTAIGEIASGVGICVFGTLANTLLLTRKPAGFPLAWLSLLCVLVSILVGVWEVTIKIGLTPQGPQKYGMMFGAVLAITVRVALNVVYVAVVTSLRKSLAARTAIPAELV